MDYGIQISASGALASIHQQDVLTNNLANVNTTGFKPIMTGTMHRLAQRPEDGIYHLPSDSMLEKLGAGVFAAQSRINFAQGTLLSSDNDLDVAIQGDGFFVVGDPSNPSLTRDGRFTISGDGELVMSSNGVRVLSDKNQPIHIDPEQGSDIHIDGNGAVSQNGLAIGQIQVSDVSNRGVLIKQGSGLFGSVSGSALSLIEGTGSVVQNMLEGSGANEIDALMKIQSVSRAAQGNIGMIDMQNRLTQRTISTFGLIA